MDTMADNDTAARFIGAPGVYLGGIPARDLTVAEYRALSDSDRARIDGSGMYTLTGHAASTAEDDSDPLAALSDQQRAALVGAGYDRPALLAAAGDEALLAVPHIGPAALERIRAATGQVVDNVSAPVRDATVPADVAPGTVDDPAAAQQAAEQGVVVPIKESVRRSTAKAAE